MEIYKVCFVGASGVGKSSILCEYHVEDRTIGFDF